MTREEYERLGQQKPAPASPGVDPVAGRLYDIYAKWTGQLNGGRIEAPMSLLLASGTIKRCTASLSNTLTRRAITAFADQRQFAAGNYAG